MMANTINDRLPFLIGIRSPVRRFRGDIRIQQGKGPRPLFVFVSVANAAV